MNLRQLKSLAKQHLSDERINSIDLDNVQITSVDCFQVDGQIHYLHDMDVQFDFTTPTKSHLIIEIRQDFVHVRVEDDWDLNQLAIINDLRNLGLLMEEA